MAEAAGGKGNIRAPSERGMCRQSRTLPVKCLQIVIRELSGGPQCDIQGPGCMPFGENEDVIVPKHLMVEHHHRVQSGEIASDVTYTTFTVHLKQPFSCTLKECPHR